MLHPIHSSCIRSLSWLAIGAFAMLPVAVSAESPAAHVHQTGMTHQSPEWAERLKAQTIIEAWRRDDNQRRPHSSLGHLTPNEFVGQRQALQTAEEAVCSG